jgi:diguanylate cyclase (GGDEF)-like protein/PAS domain S-box-containing protein
MSKQRDVEGTVCAPPPAQASLTPGLATLGADEVIRFASPEFVALIGVPAGDVRGQRLSALFEQGAMESACVSGVRDAVAEGRSFSIALRGWRSDGSPYPAEVFLIPVTRSGGQPASFIALLQDTSALSHPQLALQESDRRFQELLGHLPAGVVVHGAEGRIEHANKTAADLLGMPIEQMIGVPVSDPTWHLLGEDGSVLAPADYPAARTLAQRHNLSNLIIGICQGGAAEPVWVLCNTYLVCEHDGALSQAVVCFTDCTELKRVERALHKSEERLRLILQGSNDAPWDWNLVTNELYYPPRWWQMIGREEGELPADPWLWLRLTHPDDQGPVREFFEHALAGERKAYEVELRLRHKDGHYVPVLSRGCIQRDADGKPLRVSGTNTDLTERKEAERRIHQLAYFDYLTGLPNRRFLMEELHKLLSRSGRSGEVGAVLFIDLDNFKTLNDTLGHDVGDMLLRQAAYRLRHAVREGDYVARLGGDEFVIVLDDLGNDLAAAATEADVVGHKVLEVCAENYALPARPYSSTASVGIALFDRDTESVDALLRQADLAMYQAKAAGRNVLRFFDPLMQAAIDRRYALEHDLRDGLLRHEFRLFCQPQFDSDGRLSGGEILLRWQHPERGLVGPKEFIGTAEATGLVLQVGRWVLRESCRQLAAWAGHPVLSGIPLAVNVSAQQVHAPQFAAEVLSIIAETGADPHCLNLELTESLLAENIEDVSEKMGRLKDAGVSFSIDDFGTGYSSLSYLKRFPLQKLKIDQSFVHDIHRDPHAGVIVEVIITLARKLGLQVIAEGVEEEAQRQFLRDGGCDGFQGYLLGRPVAMGEFESRYGATH